MAIYTECIYEVAVVFKNACKPTFLKKPDKVELKPKATNSYEVISYECELTWNGYYDTSVFNKKIEYLYLINPSPTFEIFRFDTVLEQFSIKDHTGIPILIKARKSMLSNRCNSSIKLNYDCVKLYGRKNVEISEAEKIALRSCYYKHFYDSQLEKVNNMFNKSYIADKSNTVARVPDIEKVIFNKPATIVLWSDGTKTVSRCIENDIWDKETGLSMCISKKYLELLGYKRPRTALKNYANSYSFDYTDKTTDKKRNRMNESE